MHTTTQPKRLDAMSNALFALRRHLRRLRIQPQSIPRSLIFAAGRLLVARSGLETGRKLPGGLRDSAAMAQNVA